MSSIPVFESKLNFEPKFTIAIPTYKRAGLLKEAVDSALNQRDFDNFDVIVVDNNPERDCETEMLMNSYNNIRLSYYKNSENLGVCGNWNSLYTFAKGEWVVMLHDDDLLLSNYLFFLNQFVGKLAEFTIIFPSYLFFKGRNVNLDEFVYEEKNTHEVWSIVEKDFLYSNMIGNPIGMCMKRKDFILTGGFRNDFYPSLDLDFFIRASHLFKICKFPNSNPLCLYRIEENEGVKNEVILLGLKRDIEMKNALIDRCFNPFQQIWKLYFKTFSYYQLETACNAFDKKDIDIKRELAIMGFHVNKLKILIYKLIKQLRKTIFKRKKNRFYITLHFNEKH